MALPPDSLYARGFAADARTWRALRAGLEGRKVKIQRGRFAAALRTLANEPASRLLFVDLDGVAEADVAGRELTAVCAFETAVIAIGSTDTAQFTRALFQHGIADYLVKPISPALVREACASLTDDLPSRPYAGRVIAFCGSSGSGTSTLVAAVARAVAADGRTASVVDLDPLSGRLAAMLDTHPADGLSSLLVTLDRNTPTDSEPDVAPDQVDNVCATADESISLLAYCPAAALPPSPSPTAVCKLLEHLANRTHLVLVTGFPDPDLQLSTLQRADAQVLLYEPTLTSLSAAVRNLALLDTKTRTTLVQSIPRMPKSALSSAHIRYALGDRRPDVIVPFDSALHAASIGGKFRRPGKAYRNAVRKVMERVTESVPLGSGD